MVKIIEAATLISASTCAGCRGSAIVVEVALVEMYKDHLQFGQVKESLTTTGLERQVDHGPS